MVDDVKSDYINPIEFSQRINFLWWPEVILYAYVSLVMLVYAPWSVFVLHLPLLAYLAFTYLSFLFFSST